MAKNEQLRDVWERYRKGDPILDSELDALIKDTQAALDALAYRSDFGVAVRVLAQDLSTMEAYRTARRESKRLRRRIGRFIITLYEDTGKGEIYDTKDSKAWPASYEVKTGRGAQKLGSTTPLYFESPTSPLTDMEFDNVSAELCKPLKAEGFRARYRG